MGLNLFLPDTNVLIYGLAGHSLSAQFLREWIEQKTLTLSVVVVAEFLTQATTKEEKTFEALIDQFGSLPIDTTIARIAASYRKSFLKTGYKLKLPDCLIAATAKLHNAILVTFNTTDFPMKDIKKIQL
ncbi:type II toxin-antitoxin system VapC family toxin [Candidatus Gottesmanbacteria bacterium]|nr:type II toxin-antitoxin system VapC family toxin [Candidatus Gottesmanbacteria bacterium]